MHLLSELSANAVMHTRSGQASEEFIVRLQHGPCNCVCGEVEDVGSEEWGGDLAASARERSGLFIVMALASACGVAARPGVAARSGSASRANGRTRERRASDGPRAART